jgi:hypothetical protein
MTKRYGRNQKRHHREQIAELQRRAEQERMMHEDRMRQLKSSHAKDLTKAREDALTAYLNSHPQLDIILERMSEKIGGLLGPELMKHAQAIMDSARRNERGGDILRVSVRDVHPSQLGPSFDTGLAGFTIIRMQTPVMRYDLIRGEIMSCDFNFATESEP